MKKRTFTPILLLFFFILSAAGTLSAQQSTLYPEEFKIEPISSTVDLSTLLGVTSMSKIPVQGERISLTLTLHIYRTERPHSIEELTKEPVEPVEPIEERPVGTMYLRSESGEPHILFAVQELLLHGEEEIILHWGLGEDYKEAHRLSHSRLALDLQERGDPAYSWSHGLFTPQAPQWNSPFPIYVFRGMKEEGPVVFHSVDSIQKESQLHHVLVVVNFELSQ